jgi:hypothetical protein
MVPRQTRKMPMPTGPGHPKIKNKSSIFPPYSG